MSTPSHTPPSIVTEAATFIGIDCHRKYSIWHAVDDAGGNLGKGRIEHHSPHGFATLVKRWPNARIVFGVSMSCLSSSGSAAWLRLNDAAHRGTGGGTGFTRSLSSTRLRSLGFHIPIQ